MCDWELCCSQTPSPASCHRGLTGATAVWPVGRVWGHGSVNSNPLWSWETVRRNWSRWRSVCCQSAVSTLHYVHICVLLVYVHVLSSWCVLLESDDRCLCLTPVSNYGNMSYSPCSAIDCIMSEWTEWSECNKSCGKGHTIRTRMVMMEPQFGGNPCPESIQRKKCKVRKCSRGQSNGDDKKRRKEQRDKRRSKLDGAEITSEHPG